MIRRGIGVQSFAAVAGGYTPSDADALAFVNAAGISDDTQKLAINTLVTDLKGFGIWTKMRAIWPFVGGTSSSHKWNLKDPRDLDAAFRLVFTGGGTHASTGWTPNGVNGYADTFLIPSTSMNSSDGSVSYYSRTLTTTNNGIEMGCYSSGYATGIELYLHYSTATPTKTICTFYTANGNRLDAPTQNSNGFFTGNRVSNSLLKLHRNGTSVGQNTTAVTLSRPNTKIYLGASNIFGTPSGYSTKQCAFASIGDGLTDTEAANLYTSVQKYQTTLGRHVGTPIVADSDAQAFLNAAEITSVTEANAVDKLVTDLKTYGIWSKMKAIYPFVGGTSSTHKWNLKDPRDLDAAFRLVFSGGATHSSTGYLPNGTNGFADTKFNFVSQSITTNNSFGIYSRTNNTSGTQVYGVYTSVNSSIIQNNLSAGNFVSGLTSSLISYTASPSTGLLISSRRSSIDYEAYKNGVSLGNNTVSQTEFPNANFYFGARNNDGSAGFYSNHELSFAYISNSLTDTEAANLYTAVQAYQTSLSRNV